MVSATALSVIGQVAALATSLIATPFVLRLISPSQYGFLSLVTSILSYVVLADLGMGMASTRFAADALARGDEEEEVAVVWMAMLVTRRPGPARRGSVMGRCREPKQAVSSAAGASQSGDDMPASRGHSRHCSNRR